MSCTLDGRIQSWNPAAVEIFGYTREEALGADLMLIVPKEQREETADCERRVKTGEALTLETLRRHKNGHNIDVTTSLAPIRDAAGEIVGTCAVTHDITKRKRIERQLQEEARELRQTD